MAFINCAGLEARKFLGEEEGATFIPILGQFLLAQGEPERCAFYQEFNDERETGYVNPRPGSGTTVFGGCKIDMKIHDWSQNVAGNMYETIITELVK